MQPEPSKPTLFAKPGAFSNTAPDVTSLLDAIQFVLKGTIRSPPFVISMYGEGGTSGP